LALSNYVDVCRFVPTAGSTTDWTVSAAVTGYMTPAQAGALGGSQYSYRAESADLSQWEIGFGTYNSGAGVLSRGTVLFNSAGTTAKINFSVAPQVAIVALAEDLRFPLVSQARLTLTQGTAVTTSDVTSSSIYVEPSDAGDTVNLYDGTNWQRAAVPPSTISISNSGLAANTMYDVFGYLTSAGALALELLAWTNDTTRATAIAQQNGVDVKSGAPTRRLLGSARTDGSTLFNDTMAKRWLANRYNLAPREMQVVDPTFTWNYSTASFRQMNGAATNQLDFVICAAAVAVEAVALMHASNSTATGRGVTCGIGLDSATINHSNTLTGRTVADNNGAPRSVSSYWRGYPGVGRHVLVPLEVGNGNDVQSWFGVNGSPILFQSGISGALLG
jgi:hypothetical protein